MYAIRSYYVHGGAVQGYRGTIAMIPERDFGVVILRNNFV